MVNMGIKGSKKLVFSFKPLAFAFYFFSGLASFPIYSIIFSTRFSP